MSQNTANRREWKGSLPDAQYAKVLIQLGAMPAQQERRNWQGWNKPNKPETPTGQSCPRSIPNAATPTNPRRPEYQQPLIRPEPEP
jgi:hypothetical protein